MKKLLSLTLISFVFMTACATKNGVTTSEDVDDDVEIVELDYSKYKFDRPGFKTKIVDNRLWVFKEGDKEYAKFEKDGELAKHVTLPLAGPLKVTIKAPDKETVDEYLKAYGNLEEAEVDWSRYNFSKAGFITKIVDGRLWVFKEGDKEYAKFEKDGELAKHVTIPAGGPHGITIKGPDKETIDAYMAAK
ncbi:MAG: hypothetical protein N3C60_01685 [Calditerrivibrio sp.]|nr:hypothetical protein [Calditerrivibrio sp.]